MRRFFAVRKFLEKRYPRPSRAEMEASRERILANLYAKAPEAIAAFRYEPEDEPPLEPLRAVDHHVLRAITTLAGDATTTTVTRELQKLTSKPVSEARVVLHVERLIREGLVVRRQWGRGETYEYCFALTRRGKTARSVSPAVQEGAEEQLGDLASDV